MSKQDAYVEKMKQQLDALNQKMTEIEAKASEVGHEAKVSYDEEVAKIRAQSLLATEKLEQVKSAAADSWHQMVAEMEKLRHAFTSSFAYFKSQV